MKNVAKVINYKPIFCFKKKILKNPFKKMVFGIREGFGDRLLICMSTL